MRTLLFDIDGTLLMTHGGGSSALKLAVEHEFGLETVRMDIQFCGRTDRSILVDVLKRNGLATSGDHQQRLRDRFTLLFPEVLAHRGGRLLPGTLDLLNRLSQETEHHCFVMTGNLCATATRKLDHFGLLPFFAEIFGGDHDHDRNHLAERTAEVIRDRYGAEATRDMVVIGDTPADVRCGHAIGASVVAVCTGSFDREQLEAEQPMSVHDDFSDVTAIFDLLA